MFLHICNFCAGKNQNWISIYCHTRKKTMPKKIRQLIHDLEKAGFANQAGKVSTEISRIPNAGIH